MDSWLGFIEKLIFIERTADIWFKFILFNIWVHVVIFVVGDSFRIVAFFWELDSYGIFETVIVVGGKAGVAGLAFFGVHKFIILD